MATDARAARLWVGVLQARVARAPSKGADGAEEGTALFVAAVPPGWSKSTLREFMSRFGDVADASLVTLDSAPDVAGGLVRFADARGTKRALAAAVRGGAPLDPPASTARAVGLESWVADFRDAAPPPDVLQSRIDEWWVEPTRRDRLKGGGGESRRGRRRTDRGGEAGQAQDDGRRGNQRRGIRAATADDGRRKGRRFGKISPVPAAGEAAERALRAEAGVRGGQGQGRQAQGQSQVQASM